MNKNINISKFLIPISVIMVIIGSLPFINFFINFGSWFDVFYDKTEIVLWLSLIIGAILFFVGLVDQTLLGKRSPNNSMGTNIEQLHGINPIWKRIGYIFIIFTVVTFLYVYLNLIGFRD